MQAVDPQLAEFFVQDAAKSIAVLEKIQKKGGVYTDEDIWAYIIHTHCMKSALVNVGETELSVVAANLERAGRNKYMAVVASETQPFLDGLRAVVEKLSPSVEGAEDAELTRKEYEDLRDKLLAVIEACETYNRKAINGILAALRQKAWPSPVKEQLGTMAIHLLNGDFVEVAQVADALCGYTNITMLCGRVG